MGAMKDHIVNRINTLRDELGETTERVSELRAKMQTIESQLREEQLYQEKLRSRLRDLGYSPTHDESSGEFSESTITEAVAILIRRAERPLGPSELADGLQRGGYPFSGNPQNYPTVVYNTLKRKLDQFEKVGSRWALAGMLSDKIAIGERVIGEIRQHQETAE